MARSLWWPRDFACSWEFSFYSSTACFVWASVPDASLPSLARFFGPCFLRCFLTFGCSVLPFRSALSVPLSFCFLDVLHDPMFSLHCTYTPLLLGVTYVLVYLGLSSGSFHFWMVPCFELFWDIWTLRCLRASFLIYYWPRSLLVFILVVSSLLWSRFPFSCELWSWVSYYFSHFSVPMLLTSLRCFPEVPSGFLQFPLGTLYLFYLITNIT